MLRLVRDSDCELIKDYGKEKVINYKSLSSLIELYIIGIIGVADLSGEIAVPVATLQNLLDSIEDIIYCDNEELALEFDILNEKTTSIFNIYHKLLKQNMLRQAYQGRGRNGKRVYRLQENVLPLH